jgi:ataxin-3
MQEAGSDTSDFLKYMGEESGNVAEDGNYSVQVLQKALEVWNVRLVRTTVPEGRALLSESKSQVGFIANLAEHWLTLRRFTSQNIWFNLNSLLPKPQHLGELVSVIVCRCDV